MNFIIALLVSSGSAIQIKYRPPDGTVPWTNGASRPTWDTPDYPVNYYIPNFGVDHNILTTLNSLKIAENGAKMQMKAKFDSTKTPDLKTPDLGKDEEVKMA